MSSENFISEEVKVLQNLIRFNTTNPPGNEGECIKYIHNLLKEEGIESVILQKHPNRLNLVAKLKGNKNKSPFLMYGHVDVVPVENQNWLHPPFEGIIDDGYIWGRGCLDMKGSIAMMICAMLRMKRKNIVPSGDVILCLVSDEEAGGVYGAKYVVDNHHDLFQNVKYAIGEIGGTSLYLDNKKFYPIMISEKQNCALKTIIRGEGGHGSMPMHNGAMAKLGEMLTKMNKENLPTHITHPAKLMIESLAKNMGFPKNHIMNMLLKPSMTKNILKAMGESSKFFEPILHNTINATIVNGGSKVNVIPTEITLQMDGRLLPGYKPEQMIKEVKNLLGDDLEFEVLNYVKGPDKVDMGLFDVLSEVINEKDKEGIVIPFMVSGVTDARHFSRLGIQTYGFTPMNLPKDMNFSSLIHNANERIPIDALKFGTDCIYNLLQKCFIC